MITQSAARNVDVWYFQAQSREDPSLEIIIIIFIIITQIIIT